jgi:DNA-binding HxlR family transcriptional regulator
MDRASFDAWQCSVARTAGLLGDPWTLLILRDAHYGLRRFEQFHTSLGLSRNILSRRLNRLVEHGLMDKAAYQENPVRAEYTLTDKGDEFFDVLVAMVKWGDRWLDDGVGAPVTLHHTPCGHDVDPAVLCTNCGQAIRSVDIQFRVGPGHAGSAGAVGDPLSTPPGHPQAQQPKTLRALEPGNTSRRAATTRSRR